MNFLLFLLLIPHFLILIIIICYCYNLLLGENSRPTTAANEVDMNAARVQFDNSQNAHDPTQAWYTGHYDNDVTKLSANVAKSVSSRCCPYFNNHF